ncbi:hypothetical protein BC629DRAFT_1654694 [Irpex lacteus]|nr:hypothetical protein BC629DRAFT_1654694 [Irpex lacteus]
MSTHEPSKRAGVVWGPGLSNRKFLKAPPPGVTLARHTAIVKQPLSSYLNSELPSARPMPVRNGPTTNAAVINGTSMIVLYAVVERTDSRSLQNNIILSENICNFEVCLDFGFTRKTKEPIALRGLVASKLTKDTGILYADCRISYSNSCSI